MKKILLSAFCFCFSAAGLAQQWVIDPQHLAAVTANAAVRSAAESAHNHYLGQITNNLDNINTNMSSVILAQTIIYNALSNVNSALKNGMAVKNMAVTIDDMISYLDQCLDLAKSQPYLLLFATGIEKEMQARAINLVSDVSGYILNEGGNVLADYNSRDQLMRKVTHELQIIDSLAYGAWRAMYWAGQRGVIASINPYQAWISKDRSFVNQIIQNAKFLK